MQRMLCSWAKVDLSRLRRGRLDDDDWARLYEAANNLSPAPSHRRHRALTTMEMRARCRRLKAEHGLGLVWWTTSNSCAPRASSSPESRDFRHLPQPQALAKELNLPVVACPSSTARSRNAATSGP
jgi:replicative DNA helicase